MFYSPVQSHYTFRRYIAKKRNSANDRFKKFNTALKMPTYKPACELSSQMDYVKMQAPTQGSSRQAMSDAARTTAEPSQHSQSAQSQSACPERPQNIPENLEDLGDEDKLNKLVAYAHSVFGTLDSSTSKKRKAADWLPSHL